MIVFSVLLKVGMIVCCSYFVCVLHRVISFNIQHSLLYLLLGISGPHTSVLLRVYYYLTWIILFN